MGMTVMKLMKKAAAQETRLSLTRINLENQRRSSFASAPLRSALFVAKWRIGRAEKTIGRILRAETYMREMEKRGAISCGGADYVREVGIKLRKAIQGAEFEVRNAELFMRGSV